MSLYRENATGFLCEFASNPGAGYTAISAQPTDTIANRVAWWRTLDAYGDTSNWHPTASSGGEDPSPEGPTLSGSGVNVWANRYAVFEESALPPMVSVNATATQQSGGYVSDFWLQVVSAAANGYVWFGASATDYNIKLTPGRKWILSVWVTPIIASPQAFSLQIKTSGGTTYQVSLTSGGTANSAQRLSGVLDLSADTSAQAIGGVLLQASGSTLRFDGFMLEERVGTGTTPSAFASGTSVVDGAQIVNGTISGSKIATAAINATHIQDGSITATEIATGTITATQIQDATITATEIANATITGGNIANLTITGGNIAAATIDSAKIIDLAADKIAAGTITGKTITLANSASVIKSANFVAGSSGFQVRGDGAAEFRNVIVRGNLDASNLQTGTINGLRFGDSTIGAGPIIQGSLHSRAYQSSTLSSVQYNGPSWYYADAPSNGTAAVSLPANPYRTGVIILAVLNTGTNSTLAGKLCAGVMRQGTPISANFFGYSAATNDLVQCTVIHADTSPQTTVTNYSIMCHQSLKNAAGFIVYVTMVVLEFIR